MEFRLLGPLETRSDGRVVRHRGKQGALLALLLLDCGRVVSSERLVDELWGDDPPESALKALNVFVWRLKRALPGIALEKVGRGYRLDLRPEDTFDLHRFEALLKEARAVTDTEAARARDLFAKALAEWRGSPLTDFDEPFARTAAARLEDARIGALEDRIAADLATRSDGDVVGELEGLIDAYPLRERLRELFMLALYRSGRQAEALAAYQDARRTLVEELGIEPGPALQRLERGILQQDPALDAPPPERPTNLPVDLTTFVGRSSELERLRSILLEREARLVTLTGPGGSGNTRLALRIAQGLLEDLDDGVFFVGLAPLADPSLVMATMAQALGVVEAAGRPIAESVRTHLRPKETLLVLDNFEHVTGAAPEVGWLVASCPRLRVVTTSRVPLRIEGEREFEVPPLEVPPEDGHASEVARFSSVELFVDRARAIRHDFEITAENAAAIGAICTRLDGLPLAIELAAARTRVLSPVAMLRRLSSVLDLGDGSGERPSRQQTLRHSIAWSHGLLAEPERECFRRLAVFRGGSTLAAAEAVVGASGDTFSRLSLLVEHALAKTRWGAQGEPRFETLETIAEFAGERLDEAGERAEVARRHANYVVEFVEAGEPNLYTEARGPWMQALGDDRDNIRAALAWSVEHDEAELGMRILAATWLWYWLSFGEARDWAERLLALPSATTRSAAKAGTLFVAELASWGGGDAEAVLRFGEEAVAVSREVGSDKWLAFSLAVLSGGYHDDVERGTEAEAEARRVGERTGDPWIHAWTMMTSAIWAQWIEDLPEAEKWGAEAASRFRELGDPWSGGSASTALGIALLQQGELERARTVLAEALEALVTVRDLKMANTSAIALAMSARFGGDLAAARGYYEQALELCAQAGDPANAPFCLEGMAAAVAEEDPQRAARLLGAAHAIFETIDIPVFPGFEVFYEGTREALGAVLGDELDPLLDSGREDVDRGIVLGSGYLATSTSR